MRRRHIPLVGAVGLAGRVETFTPYQRKPRV